MTDQAATPPWTCPFCPLACDHLGVQAGGAAPLQLVGGHCPRAAAALARIERSASAAALLDGAVLTLDAAVATAAAWLSRSRQPLFGGLGLDVQGARALYPLACVTGAVADSSGGDAFMQALRALQDRGQFTATLAEVRNRAEVLVFIGPLPLDLAPLLPQRLGLGAADMPARHLVVLGPAPGDEATLAAWAQAAAPGRLSVECIALQGDLFDALGELAALLTPRSAFNAAPYLAPLAERLRRSAYSVLLGVPPQLPAQGALIIEAVHRVVGHLNRNTRAAAFWLGGGNGAATVNQVFAWLSGLPLRSRAGPHGLEHEPVVFDAQRLLDDGAVDSVLWLASFDAASPPPAHGLPMVVLGPPALASACQRPGVPTLFIAVATPGVGHAGHLFRTDGTVLMPLDAVFDDPLPSAAQVLHRVHALMPSVAGAGKRAA